MIPYFDQDLDEETEKNLDKINKIIPDTVTEWNNGDTGNVIVLYLKSSTQEDIIQLSQVSRLFVSHFIKYSTTPEEYAEKLQNVYILTSDVDLLPLSTKYFYLNSYDWNLVNVIQNHLATKKINIALSCVGALTRTWYKTVPETRYNVEFYNDTGIRSMLETERVIYIEAHPKSLKKVKSDIVKVDWLMDQSLISKWIEGYAEEYGWDTIHQAKQGSERKKVDRSKRVRRPLLKTGQWDGVVDRQIHEGPWKDSHYCQGTYLFDCFWKVYILLKPIVSEKLLTDLINYKSHFTDVVLEIGEKVISDKEMREFVRNEDLRNQFLKELSDRGLPGIDMRRIWTHHYPKKFDRMPAVVDWEDERLFKVQKGMESKNKLKFSVQFYVIPKYHSGDENTTLKLNGFVKDQFKSSRGDSCSEVLF